MKTHVISFTRLLPVAVIFTVVGLLAGGVGCSTVHRDRADASHSNLAAREHSKEHSEHAAPAGYLELNAGKKWVVAKPMMAHIRKMEGSVREFEGKPGADHAALAIDIQENLGRLVTNCTMEGKAHDELHKWLMPFLGMSAEYTQATEPQAQAQKFHEIKQALLVFNQYFE